MRRNVCPGWSNGRFAVPSLSSTEGYITLAGVRRDRLFPRRQETYVQEEQSGRLGLVAGRCVLVWTVSMVGWGCVSFSGGPGSITCLGVGVRVSKRGVQFSR